MQGALRKLDGVARTFWLRLREWSGDAAYEKYQRVAARKNCGNAITRERFYMEQAERRYSRPNRCC
jgi:uncharacterized short protein YbdD (DUF466 family)